MGVIFSGQNIHLVVRSVAYEGAVSCLGAFIDWNKAKEVRDAQRKKDQDANLSDYSTVIKTIVFDREIDDLL